MATGKLIALALLPTRPYMLQGKGQEDRSVITFEDIRLMYQKGLDLIHTRMVFDL
ncbi:MAG: hypothetical protein JRH08_13800 [Deltaproteobacteria bacterium]|nr:hypothetical protein [Deltaproteobacteria bacterium]MBW1929407.1 hypothetical protein [Deltaproteobacteria bacterium]MBW2126721.1 hypothetical protein [Deltaproteobacteria bacterium]